MANSKTSFKSHTKSAIFCFLFTACIAFIWLLTTSNSWKDGGINHILKGLGSFLGLIGYCFFSLSLFLSSRWKKLEDWFGGLDQIYRTHILMGIWGFSFILAHPLILALKWVPNKVDKFLLFLFPLHDRFSVNLGSYSFWLMIVILGITLLKLFPYDKWKISHKFMSLVFILASFHFLTSYKLFGRSELATILLLIPMGLGLSSIIYKQIVYEFLLSYPIYEVVKTKKLNENTVTATLEPKKGNLAFTPGQYAFFSFKKSSLTSESHPFTLLGNASGSNISIIVKVRGDFTKSLYNELKPKDLAYVEGPYGKFNYMKAKSSQIWIAGGIGIAPFLIWSKELCNSKNTTKEVTLFYCVHKKSDAIFLDEFHDISQKLQNFNFSFFCSEESNRLNAIKVQEKVGKLKDSTILMCGPKRMTNDLTKQLIDLGINRKNIIFEDFEFL